VPKPHVQYVSKELPVYTIQAQERVVEVPQVLKADRPVEKQVVQRADIVREVLKPETQTVDKQVPKFETQAIEKVEEVPHMLTEERAVEVPEMQHIELQRQEVEARVQEVMKEIPKVCMEYVEKVVEISSQLGSNSHGDTVTRTESVQRDIPSSRRRVVEVGPVQWRSAPPVHVSGPHQLQ